MILIQITILKLKNVDNIPVQNPFSMLYHYSLSKLLNTTSLKTDLRLQQLFMCSITAFLNTFHTRFRKDIFSTTEKYIATKKMYCNLYIIILGNCA